MAKREGGRRGVIRLARVRRAMRRAGHIEDYETDEEEGEEEGEEDGRFGRKASWRIVAGKSLLVRAPMQAVEVWMSTWGLREM
eukprot:7791-Pyramimonas_sp.AAC.1